MSFSLLSSINTCKVNTAYQERLQSDRFENPDNMTCFVWNGLDNYGRPVSADSYYTKAPGCNDASDRVQVENFQRPRYIEYVSLDARGIKGSNQAPPQSQARQQLRENFTVGPSSNAAATEAGNRVQDYYKITGSFGNDYMSNNTPRISGLSAALGDPDAYQCCGSRGRNVQQGGLPELKEPYEPRLQRQNFQNRQMASAVANYKSAIAASHSGRN